MPYSIFLVMILLMVCYFRAAPSSRPIVDISPFKPHRIFGSNLRNSGLNKMVTNVFSPNENNLTNPRNGLQVVDNGDGFEITPHGFLYEKLGIGYGQSMDLREKAFRIRYSSRSTQKNYVTLLEKYSAKFKLGSPFQLKATEMEFQFEAGAKAVMEIPLTEFQGAKASKSYAIKVHGPLTVHRIELVNDRNYGAHYERTLIDGCKGWTSTPSSYPVTIFTYDKENEFQKVELPKFVNINLGGGGEVWELRHHALKITYSTTETKRHPVYIQQEEWDGDYMGMRLFVDKNILFKKGDQNVLIIPMREAGGLLNRFNPLNVHGISIQGPINYLKVEIIADTYE